MKNLLTEALTILRGTKANDTSNKARGRRAHARALTMVSLADETAELRREQRITNLLTLAQVDTTQADRALREARRMMAEDEPEGPDRLA